MEEYKTNQKLLPRTNNVDEWQIDPLIQDDVGYADDATLVMGRDNREQMRERIGNYDIVTEPRELKI